MNISSRPRAPIIKYLPSQYRISRCGLEGFAGSTACLPSSALFTGQAHFVTADRVNQGMVCYPIQSYRLCRAHHWPVRETTRAQSGERIGHLAEAWRYLDAGGAPLLRAAVLTGLLEPLLLGAFSLFLGKKSGHMRAVHWTAF